MELWLLRHGEAVPHGSKPDDERELTERGQLQSIVAGEALARLGVNFDACYTSPLVRARGTARLACRSLDVTPRSRKRLGKGFGIDDARAMLRPHGANDRVLIVGHNPSFEEVIRAYTGAQVDLKKGGAAFLRVDGTSGDVRALFRPRELELIAASQSS